MSTLGNIAADALRRVPAVVASGFVVFMVFAGLWIVGSAPVALVAVAGGGGAAIVLTVVFVVLLLFVATAWLWGRLTLASAIAASGGHGLGVRRSWELTTHGRFWFVVGRLVITGLLAGAVGGVVNVVTTFGQFMGFVVFVVVVVLLQALAVAASMIVTVCGYLVTADQVDDSTHNSDQLRISSSRAMGFRVGSAAMEISLDGKVALVTGASKGIGKAIATSLAASGAKVMINSRKQDQLEAARAEMTGDVEIFAANAGDADRASAPSAPRSNASAGSTSSSTTLPPIRTTAGRSTSTKAGTTRRSRSTWRRRCCGARRRGSSRSRSSRARSSTSRRSADCAPTAGGWASTTSRRRRSST